jgi:hypothetical protein
MILGYIVVCLCWCILGAVLNPELFLPFAAAAVTFVLFIMTKTLESVSLLQAILVMMVEEITLKMKLMLEGMLEKIIAKIQSNEIDALQ